MKMYDACSNVFYAKIVCDSTIFIVVQSIIHPFSSKIFSQSVLVILPNFRLTVFFVTVKQ